MQDTRRVHPIQISDLKEALLNAVDRNPSTSVCALTASIIAPASTMWRVLHVESLHAFHLQRDRILPAEDYPRLLELHKKCVRSALPMICFVY
ncbi:hypothetical protein CDAR_605201 [Caerostris darwini]|uniref:Uncharacterized protein n=1 Tax=Caerostris darwini TaxID=1538125 RepID=A0AAV4U8P8_9ARAC|nr:hypothetical protein CDAR_605201 [Caerostris darwini]